MSLRRFLGDRSGNMAVLFACGFSLSAAISVLAVDTASLYHERRRMQAAVDLAAIAAVADQANAGETARAVLVESGLLAEGSDDGLTVVTGNYDPSRPQVAARFVAGATPVNAVRVTFERRGTLHFGSRMMGAPLLGTSGTAAVTPEVSFSVGSRLASLNGGIANALLSTLLGTTVSLSVLDYAALASARVDAFDFLDALAGQLGVTAGSYESLLAMDAPTGSVAAALAGVTTGATRTALTALSQSGAGNTVPLDKLLSLGALGKLEIGSERAVAGLSLSVIEMLSAAAALAEGDRQVSLQLGANLPNLASLRIDLAVGEPPQGGGWFAFGPVGTRISTAQLRLKLDARLLGGPLLLGAGVKLPLWLGMAPAEARVVAAQCPSDDAPLGAATIAVSPGIASLAPGDLDAATLRNFSVRPQPGATRLIDLLLLRVTGRGEVFAGQTGEIALPFSSIDIAAGTARTARTQTVATSLAASLLNGMLLDVELGGLNLTPKALVEQAVRLLVTPLAPTLDMTIDAVFSTLGLGVGEADVRVYGVRCHNAVLVG